MKKINLDELKEKWNRYEDASPGRFSEDSQSDNTQGKNLNKSVKSSDSGPKNQ